MKADTDWARLLIQCHALILQNSRNQLDSYWRVLDDLLDRNQNPRFATSSGECNARPINNGAHTHTKEDRLF